MRKPDGGVRPESKITFAYETVDTGPPLTAGNYGRWTCPSAVYPEEGGQEKKYRHPALRPHFDLADFSKLVSRIYSTNLF